MNNVKVYNKDGKLQTSVEVPVHAKYDKFEFIKSLNEKGFFVRSQFSKSGKTLMRSYEGMQKKIVSEA